VWVQGGVLVTRLCKMMLEQLQRRNYSESTQSRLPAGSSTVRLTFRQVARLTGTERTANLSSLLARRAQAGAVGTVVARVAAL